LFCVCQKRAGTKYQLLLFPFMLQVALRLYRLTILLTTDDFTPLAGTRAPQAGDGPVTAGAPLTKRQEMA
jgi:hypothetical protein